MSEFQFKEVDHEGWTTLNVIGEADNFNQWMYETIAPYCQGKTLEIGSGIGNISQYFVQAKSDIVLSDVRSVYCNVLKKNFRPQSKSLRLTLRTTISM
jgi:hypothetical protein